MVLALFKNQKIKQSTARLRFSKAWCGQLTAKSKCCEHYEKTTQSNCNSRFIEHEEIFERIGTGLYASARVVYRVNRAHCTTAAMGSPSLVLFEKEHTKKDSLELVRAILTTLRGKSSPYLLRPMLAWISIVTRSSNLKNRHKVKLQTAPSRLYQNEIW